MTPASIRYYNPGAMYPGPSARRFGSIGTQTIGGGHKIAVFDDPVKGAAAQFDLLNRNYAGMPLAAAISKWSGGNSSPSYARQIASQTGLQPDTLLTRDMLSNPNVAIPMARAMANWEAGQSYPMSGAQWGEAFKMALGGPLPNVPDSGAQQMPTYRDVGGAVAPQGLSPAEVNQKLAMAKMLMQRGQAPVGHWTQALGNVLNSAAGNYQLKQAMQGEKEGQAGANAALAQALTGNAPNWAALMQDPRTREIGVKGLMEERALKTKMADPLYRAKIEEAQMNAAQARAGLAAQNELFGAGAPVPDQVSGAPAQNAPLVVEFGGKQIPLERAQRAVAALSGTNPKLAQALGKEVDKAVRMRELEKMGMDPDSAEGQVYLLTGKVPTKAYERMANETKKAERAQNIAGGLGELQNLTKDFDTASFESAVGPYQGSEPDSLAGAVPINIARAFGELSNWWNKGKSAPSEVRSAIRGSTEALAAAIKPLIRGPGEGPWTDADQARLVAVVGDLPQASTKKEFLSRLNRVRDRVKSNFGIEIPFDAFSDSQTPTPATPQDEWRTIGNARIREVR